MFLLILLASPKNWQVHSRLLMLPLPEYGTKKKFGQKQSTAREASEDEGHVNLQEAMGFKKPAAALKKAKTASKPLKKDLKSKKPATSSPLKKGKALKKAGREPWVKIRKTMAKKPERAYLVGAHNTDCGGFPQKECALFLGH